MERWGPAVRAFDGAYDPPSIRHLSAKNLTELRDRTESALASIEALLNRHIQNCAACQTDGRKAEFDSTAPYHR
jgi:hypothetical protein